MSLPGEPSTVPVYDRNTGEKLLDAGPEHLAQIAALVEDGVEEGQMLLLAIFADHLHAGGTVSTFVLNGVAYGPLVENALDAVLDSHLDAQAALDHLLSEMEEPVGLNPLMVEPEEPESSTPGLDANEPRVELRQVYKGRGAEDEWQVRNDFEVFERHTKLEDAEKALEHYHYEKAPRPGWMEPAEETELPDPPDETEDPVSWRPGPPEFSGKPENPGKPK